MLGGGHFGLEPGQWTDDTSMALCLATSLLARRKFDPNDQMQRYCRWHNDGYLSSTGKCFDVGRTTKDALLRFQSSANPFAGSSDPRSAGNGSIMRLAPVSLFFFPDLELIEHYAAESSKTTHGAMECVDACRLLARVLGRALRGESKHDAVLADADSFAGAAAIEQIARGSYLRKSLSDVRGTGYVVHSLESALYCFMHTSSFREAVLMAANLGDDADTTAAVCGQIAGAFYGAEAIPATWRSQLALCAEIVLLADQLHDRQLPIDVEQDL
jgi:ADP-ribosyl-[dinitrogen reductase] hydrolase